MGRNASSFKVSICLSKVQYFFKSQIAKILKKQPTVLGSLKLRYLLGNQVEGLRMKILTIFVFLFVVGATAKVNANPITVEAQRALLSSGAWYCSDPPDEDGTTFNLFEQYLPSGGYTAVSQIRSSDLDVDVILAGEWTISSKNVISQPANGWFKFENGQYSEELGEEGYDAIIEEFKIAMIQEMNKNHDFRIIQLTNEKLSMLDEDGELSQCTKATRSDIRLKFGIYITG